MTLDEARAVVAEVTAPFIDGDGKVRGDEFEVGEPDCCRYHRETWERMRDALRVLFLLATSNAKEVESMRALLREVEWGGWNAEEWSACPVCKASRDDPHAPDCRLAAFLK